MDQQKIAPLKEEILTWMLPDKFFTLLLPLGKETF